MATRRGRPPSGTTQWNAISKTWEMRTIINGHATRWYAMPGVKVDDPARAKQLAAEMAMQLHQRNAPRTSGETFAKWSERWIASRVLKGLSSAKENKHQLDHVLPLLGHLAVSAIQPDDVRAVAAMLDQKVIDKTISAKSAKNVWAPSRRRLATPANPTTIYVYGPTIRRCMCVVPRRRASPARRCSSIQASF